MKPFYRLLCVGLAVAPGVAACLLASGTAPMDALRAALALSAGWALGAAALEAGCALVLRMGESGRPGA